MAEQELQRTVALQRSWFWVGPPWHPRCTPAAHEPRCWAGCTLLKLW